MIPCRIRPRLVRWCRRCRDRIRRYLRPVDRAEHDAQAEAQAQALIELVRPKLPIDQPLLESAGAWAVVGPALIARQVGTLEAIFALHPLGRDADPVVLARSLYEHAVTFAWLAADPSEERHRRFRKSDLVRRLKIDDDCRGLTDQGVKVRIMSPIERQGFEQQLNALPEDLKQMPDLIDRADGADRHWTGTIEGLAGSDTTHSFRGFYAVTYRHESATAHATELGLNWVTKDLPGGGKRVQLEERDPASHGPFGRAVLMLAFSLLIAAEAIPGWPSAVEVTQVFERS